MSKVAAIQMCSGENIEANLMKAGKLINEAAKNHAKLIVLPEMFALIAKNATEKVLFKEKFSEGKIQAFLSTQAKAHGVWIVGGTIPIACDNPDKIRAASLVYNNQGHCVARYDKSHLFDVTLSTTEKYAESDTMDPGSELVVADTPFGKLGLAVCYDIRFPELFRELAQKGAEIFVLPSAFTVPTGKAHWEVLVRCRAIENFCYMIAACQGGHHASGRKTYGHSMIIEPWGNIAAEKTDDAEGIIYATIDLQKVYEARKRIPVFK